jgi:hypothetical protein
LGGESTDSGKRSLPFFAGRQNSGTNTGVIMSGVFYLEPRFERLTRALRLDPLDGAKSSLDLAARPRGGMAARPLPLLHRLARVARRNA